MDLFNKKKVAALKDDIKLLSARLEATSKTLDDLQREVINSYKDLTDYFAPKYLKKYFKFQSTKGIVYIQCLDLYYNAGLIHMTVKEPLDEYESKIILSISELKDLIVTTKNEYLTKGETK